MIACNSQDARMWFKLREPANWAICIAILILLILTIAAITHEYITTFVASVSVVSALYYYVLYNRAIPIKCDKCDNIILSTTPWVCGSCGAKNESVNIYSFLNECQKCQAQPKAYKCHHEQCGKLIYFTPDKQSLNYAYCLNTPGPEPTLSTEEKEESEFNLKQKRLNYITHLRKLETDLIMTEQVFNSASKKSMSYGEKVEEHRKAHHDRNLKAREIYEKEKKEIAEKYKDNPEMMRAENDELEKWFKDGSWERII